MDVKEQILNLIKIEGPVLPVQISKKIHSDITLAGAMLSEMVARRIIKISSAKIGGSPVYYIEGQEAKLSKLYDYLPGKEKEAYNLLKEKKTLKDKECEPAIRVALRQIKDFAFPFIVNNEINWRWYLIKQEALGEKPIEKTEEIKIEEPKIEVKELGISFKETFPEKLQQKEEEKEPVEVKKKTKKIKERKNLWFDKINSYLASKKIELLETKDIKRNEINMVIKFSSDFGRLQYFLYAKDKKTISDDDLRLAYSKGQQSKLPILFLSSGELSKKAQTYLENISGYLVFRKL